GAVQIGTSGRLYLAAILDLYSRFVVGWAVSAVNDRHLTLNALDQTLRRRGPPPGLLHHSDQGCAYASADYQRVVEARGLVCIMSRRGIATITRSRRASSPPSRASSPTAL